VLISRAIDRPLRKLSRAVEGMRDNTEITEAFDDSQIGKVGRALKETVHASLELTEKLVTSQLKEREAELLLLQAQINPHFLYNTLDSIYCMAIISKNDVIAEMVASLSDLFKLSLCKGKREITVREELDYIRKYMTIQRLRYGDRFTLEVDMDEALLDKRILKFILQPFVENAMYHGLEPKMGGGFIRVEGKVDGEDMVFTITDNGVGIMDKNDICKGYGIGNVADRLRLRYGEKYGIHVSGAPNKGTRVEVRVPAVQAEGI
jgi:two-component system, sensor histidine kinase YesM